MPNIFCCCGNKKIKGIQQPHSERKSSIIYVHSGSRFEGGFAKSTFRNSLHRRSSNTLSNDPEYLNILFGLSRTKIMRSHLTSPGKSFQSDQKLNNMKKDTPGRCVDSGPQQTPPGSKEPFPYQIPDALWPRRSTICYGVKLEDNAQDSHDFFRDDALPSTSNFPSSTHMRKEDYRVEISDSRRDVKPASDNENLPSYEGNGGRVRTTIVRFRPHSSGSFSQPASVKVMPVRADQIEHPPDNMNVHQIPLKPTKQCPMLMTVDGRMLQPVEQNKVRRVSLSSEKEARSARGSVVGPEREGEDVSGFPTQPIGYAAPMMHRRSSVGRPSISRSSLSRENKATRRSSMADSNENKPFPFNQQETTPAVYAVPVVTRGRTRSVLQQSVKNLTSRRPSDQPTINRKNIRYSMDTDVFSADARRRSIAQPAPGYVNMERGQAVLVSELLNPITSLFISDLKDPVPKDPLTKPKDKLIWIEPRRTSGQRQSVLRPPLRQSVARPVSRRTPQAHGIQQQAKTKKRQPLPVQRRLSRDYYKHAEEYSSSSDESVDDFRRNTKQSVQKRSYKQHAVYAAQMPSPTLPDLSVEKSEDPPSSKKRKHHDLPQSSTLGNDFCGLSCEKTDDTKCQKLHPLTMVSSAQQTEIEDDVDILCYPSEKFLKNTALASESGSKLRWRIVIKRGDEK